MPANGKCWICGTIGPLTAEHQVKATMLKDLFGPIIPERRLYFHNQERPNQRLKSWRADRLKFDPNICQACNSSRTQPYDDAWTLLSRALLRRVPTMAAGQRFRANRVFRYNTRRQMLNVHLYFIKLFGCMIASSKAPIDLAPFAMALMSAKAHPDFYLKFGRGIKLGKHPHVGGSDVHIASDPSGVTAYALWALGFRDFSMLVIYARPNERLQAMVNAWQPRRTNNLTIVDLEAANDGVSSRQVVP